MGLAIETFSNVKGGNSFYKAICHPLSAISIQNLLNELAKAGPVAIYDPLGFVASLDALHPLADISLAGIFVQDFQDLGRNILGKTAQPVTDLPAVSAKVVFVAAFDADRLIQHIRHLLPKGSVVRSLDEARLPDKMLTRPRSYLDPLNFATNYAFFRDSDGHHTRLTTANYWSGYGAKNVSLWCRLFDVDGNVLAEWQQAIADGPVSIAIDSQDIRRRFNLGPFIGQLFIHVINPNGHDVVKYALDTYGDEPTVLSCTHDANAWPSELYAGLPAPRKDERVVLWVQNSHPCAIPQKAITVNLMGSDTRVSFEGHLPPFGSAAIDIASLLPKAEWPQQIEINAGKYCVRPRYEVSRTTAEGKIVRQRIAHVNVERSDLKPDATIPDLGNLLGKGYILPAPILPMNRFRSIALPTPMSTAQKNMPVALRLYDAKGHEVMQHQLGCLPRRHDVMVDVETLLNGRAFSQDSFGHMELVYDFDKGGEADGWLHALFRYEDKKSEHAAETSFGAHIFNTVLTYRGEPQSYAGRPPGLSTRLFLRLAPSPLEAFCHLIYAASAPWNALSQTDLILHDHQGQEVAKRQIEIPCSGSYLWRVSEVFDAAELRKAGGQGYVLIRDMTCRLFGYHGLFNGDSAFSLDHMFGF